MTLKNAKYKIETLDGRLVSEHKTLANAEKMLARWKRILKANRNNLKITALE
jgi:hypothetical protein